MTLTVGVDIGGTKLVAGLVTAAGDIVATRWHATPPTAAEMVSLLGEVVTTLAAEHAISAVGLGMAGWIDAEGAVVRHSPNLGWRDVPLRDWVAAETGLPVVLENDANAAAWAEFRFGAAVGVRRLIALTVGTGIGGGIVLDGAVFRGAFGQAGEFGHTRVQRDGQPCGCGGRGCLEQYASGTALEHYVAQSHSDDDGAASTPALDGPEIAVAAAQGDPVALAAFAEVGQWLGVAMADVVAVWDPECIVLGGGVAETGDLLLRPTLAAFHAMLRDRGRQRPYADVVQAALGNTAGLIGAADLARLAATGNGR